MREQTKLSDEIKTSPKRHRKPRRSLRTILILWFSLFSIIPIIFLTSYSLKKFQQAIDNELIERLKGNASEISIILSDYKKSLSQKRRKYVEDPILRQALFQHNPNIIRDLGDDWLRSDVASGLSFYNEKGKLITALRKSDKGEIREENVPSDKNVFLTKEIIENLHTKTEITFADFSKNKELQLITVAPVRLSANIIGYIHQNLILDRFFLNRIYERMQTHAILLQSNGGIIVGSHNDFSLYNNTFFVPFYQLPNIDNTLLNIPLRGNLFGFIIDDLKWGENTLYLAIGASKKESNLALKKITYTFFTVVGVMILFLIISVFVASKLFLKPLNELLEAIEDLSKRDQAIEIPIKNDTEVGLLTASFNEMSRNIMEARGELKNKISELEKTNKDLRETQSQLVQSAKLASIGQLVAGVAHELNNPIGFIYSNMEPLKDYSQALMELIDIAENNPENLEKAKNEKDLIYITQDLPKLINSCQEGARRVKDIVIGLRNFSRLEEKSSTPTQLIELIETTLQLLSSELKNRVEVIKDFESVPAIQCNRGQISQVIMNLLSNAAQAIHGNGKIWIATKFLKADSKTENRIAISIQDDGTGIPSEIIEKIFDPFFTTKDVGRGTGLGLSISYGIIQNHGGTIQVRSEETKGTEFTIILPL
jgi:two-component system NtrC family sensor kinase